MHYHIGTFMDRFYEIFLASSDQVRAKFSQTDMKSQKQILLISLSYMMMAHQDTSLLTNAAIKHNASNRDISPSLYVNWLNSMIRAVEQTDRQFSTRTERAWRVVLQPGIDYMTSQYDD